MIQGLDPQDALALLAWQVEAGATEAIGDAPVDRYAAPPPPEPKAAPADGPSAAVAEAPPRDAGPDAVGIAEEAAAAAQDLEGLRAALAAFEGCELKRGAKSLVFCDGDPAARVMIIGEAPGREEDQQGKPFVGRAGRLLDRMFAAIGLGRDRPGTEALYITNILPWRPPHNRDPNADEIAMMLPFIRRHVDLVDPELVIPMGNISCQGLLGRRGITRLRGTWTEALGRPALPMLHPAYLLRNPAAKRESWADLLALQARLRGDGKE
ncbi:DNA polymerase [Tranquillimonas rosea]|uniref:Type-4 uracil-DNA glycosylase n=1 Tax=Tranquillimonas rosea TaxID=641238 RepID=A0A1H9SEL3_9RHOB|nr:uracil-DNA glycosylase [Tranquillimonas rosea]SER83411.1 DNA polymerase [Tranquillimonas rosea]